MNMELQGVVKALNDMITRNCVKDRVITLNELTPGSFVIAIAVQDNGEVFPIPVKMGSRTIQHTDLTASTFGKPGQSYVLNFSRWKQGQGGIYGYRADQFGDVVNHIYDFLFNSNLPPIEFSVS